MTVDEHRGTSSWNTCHLRTATKHDLEQLRALLRSDMRAESATLRSEIATQIGSLRDELLNAINSALLSQQRLTVYSTLGAVVGTAGVLFAAIRFA